MSSDNSTVDGVYCGTGGGADTYYGLRIGSIFVILATSLVGCLFPVLARRTQWLSDLIPVMVFRTAKYFGSGVIIATAFIHLLSPGMSELSSPCLNPAWLNYPYALAICLLSIYTIFVVELVAFRWGTAKLAKLGLTHDPHGHGIGAMGAHIAHGPEPLVGAPAEPTPAHEKSLDDAQSAVDVEAGGARALADSALAEIVGIAILEFGVVLHSVLIGLTLAVDPEFKILFVVIVFHQMFEGLGVGSRLAFMHLPPQYNYVPPLAACVYALCTPIGIAAGLGIRTTYNPNTPTASIVSGVLDSFSSGILIYTGLVELMAHEFVFNRDMIGASRGRLAYVLVCMAAGIGLMGLLGRWA